MSLSLPADCQPPQVTLAEAERRLQELCRAFVPALVGAQLFRGLRDAIPAARALLVPDDAPSQLEGCRAALACAALCVSARAPRAGRLRAQPAARLAATVAIHLRVVHHHRLAVHDAFLRLAADTSRGLRVPAGGRVVL